MNRICRRIFIPLAKYPKIGIDAPEIHLRFISSNNLVSPSVSLLKHIESYKYCAVSMQCRYKSKKAKSKNDSDDEEDFDDGDASLSRDSKVVKFNTTSLRADGILKLGLGVARKLIVGEMATLPGKNRQYWVTYNNAQYMYLLDANSNLPYIASNVAIYPITSQDVEVHGCTEYPMNVKVRIGDELDVIKSVSPRNPDHLTISRLEILDVVANEDSIGITARRFKSLLIDNYEVDPYKGSSEENN